MAPVQFVRLQADALTLEYTVALQALEGEGYVTPTPIQVQAIPVVLKGTALLGICAAGGLGAAAVLEAV